MGLTKAQLERRREEARMDATRDLWVEMFRDRLAWLMDEDFPEALVEAKVKKAAHVADRALEQIEERWGR